ncbi:hypothetical protein EHV23_04080 [Lautropia dentalis]|uniref:Uncharacterized protein n=1 Tax=Lautropia dentalis TaxID=2490857 RepID=A0A3R8MUD4_9BURK|nr:hypothetical protein [Lautropia dentalis]RRN45393.1 hypothetical protein EHV23_04080 [Lautropia dentalis]
MKKLMTIAAMLLLATYNAHATSNGDNALENAYASEQKISLPTLGLGNIVTPPTAIQPMHYNSCILRVRAMPGGEKRAGARDYCRRAHIEYMKLRRK